MRTTNNTKKGQLTLQLLIFGGVAVIFLAGFLIWLDSASKSTIRNLDKAQAFVVAEAGIEYYRWHLAHAPQDFSDGTSTPGPYIHDYTDKNGNVLGQFVLNITPPPFGSTIATIESKGKLSSDPTVEKTIKVRMGIPSFAKFAAVLNENVRFGPGTEVFGAVHSNSGVRFDGIAHNLVTSGLASYDDPDHSDTNLEFGVHTHVNPPPGTGTTSSFRPLEAPPNPVPDRPDVFLAGRQFPVPTVDFVGITQTLAQIKADAQAGGFYAPSSTAFGYDIQLKTNNTFDLYRVTGLVPSPSSDCAKSQTQGGGDQSGWGTWSIQAETFLGNNPIPANGLIFIEDDVWVKGQINASRVTIASARFPDNSATRSSITINDNLLYTNYDGRDAISLLAQKNINIGWVSQDILRVDAALMAQNGRVGRYYYNGFCAPYHARNTITTYGMIASAKRYGFAYANGTGYQTRNLIYDSNLLYGPPPSFPLTTDSYQTISWDETK